MGLITVVVFLTAIAVFAWTAVRVAPYPAPWGVPWQSAPLGAGRAAANAAIRLLVLGAIALALVWPFSAQQAPAVAIPTPTYRQVTPTAFAPFANSLNLPDLTWLWIGLTTAAVGLLAATLIRRRWRLDKIALTPSAYSDVLAGAADEALTALMSDVDARRAILACYEKMERSLARRGLSRRSEETAIEYARRVLLESGAPREPVLSLTTLFHVAGFSTHPINETMRSSAMSSVREISEAAS